MIRKCRLRDFFGQWWGHFAFLLLVPLAPLCAFGYFRNPVSQTFFSTPIDCQSTTPFTLGFQSPLPTPLSSFMVFDSSIFFLEREWQREEVKCIFLVIQLSNVECFPFFHQSFDQLVRFSPSFFFPSLPSQKSKKTLRCPVMFYFSWSSCWQHSKPVHQRQTGTWQDC